MPEFFLHLHTTTTHDHTQNHATLQCADDMAWLTLTTEPPPRMTDGRRGVKEVDWGMGTRTRDEGFLTCVWAGDGGGAQEEAEEEATSLAPSPTSPSSSFSISPPPPPASAPTERTHTEHADAGRGRVDCAVGAVRVETQTVATQTGPAPTRVGCGVDDGADEGADHGPVGVGVAGNEHGEESEGSEGRDVTYTYNVEVVGGVEEEVGVEDGDWDERAHRERDWIGETGELGLCLRYRLRAVRAKPPTTPRQHPHPHPHAKHTPHTPTTPSSAPHFLFSTTTPNHDAADEPSPCTTSTTPLSQRHKQKFLIPSPHTQQQQQLQQQQHTPAGAQQFRIPNVHAPASPATPTPRVGTDLIAEYAERRERLRVAENENKHRRAIYNDGVAGGVAALAGGMADRMGRLSKRNKTDSIMWLHTAGDEERRAHCKVDPTLTVHVHHTRCDPTTSITWARCHMVLPTPPHDGDRNIDPDPPVAAEEEEEEDENRNGVRVGFRACTELYQIGAPMPPVRPGAMVEMYDPVELECGWVSESGIPRNGVVLLCTRYVVVGDGKEDAGGDA
ncbi:hypothetical protein DFJ77DRAFT_440192 [Powellomyces hirtus]|nr:hypothetical protein DFJ77DRAFT_440192 [Powellomyces hirtus]